MKIQKITVFGNEIDDHDNTALLCLPLLRQKFPTIEFLIQDPTESLDPVGDPWIILDTAIGIDHVAEADSLDELEYVKGTSVHDFDVYMELRLRAKLAPLPRLKLILAPQGDDPIHATEHIVEILEAMSRA